MKESHLLVLGTVLFLTGALVYSSIYSLRVRKWPFVVGKLINADVKIFDRSAWGNVKYEYEVDGKKYVGERLSTFNY